MKYSSLLIIVVTTLSSQLSHAQTVAIIDQGINLKQAITISESRRLNQLCYSAKDDIKVIPSPLVFFIAMIW